MKNGHNRRTKHVPDNDHPMFREESERLAHALASLSFDNLGDSGGLEAYGGVTDETEYTVIVTIGPRSSALAHEWLKTHISNTELDVQLEGSPEGLARLGKEPVN